MKTLLVVGAMAMAVAGYCEIIDRISVRVGTRMITSSEINLRVRLTAFQNREKPDITFDRRKVAAQQLIDQRIVDREMEVGHYPRLNASERTELLAAFATQRYAGNAGALGSALEGYGITPADLEGDLARQEDLLAFLGLRFRLGTDTKQADADLDAWLKEQRIRTGVEYLEKELGP